MRQHRTLEILLIEDNSADAFLTYETLRESSIPSSVRVVKDAVTALALLLGDNGASGMPKPDIILLDLNLPVMDGFGFLAEAGKSEALKDVPVFVLSASSSETDIARAQSLGASGYFVKPLDIEEFDLLLSKHFKPKEREK